MARIIGRQIMLREYRKEDLPSIRRWVNDSEITDNLSDIFLYPHSLKETEDFLNFMLENKSQNTKGFVIAHKDSGEYIGQIDLLNIDWPNRVARIGIVIGVKKYLGRGYGTEAIKLLKDFAFNRLNLHKLELEVRAFNKRAINCYKKCGFIEEGRLRENFYHKGRYEDTLLMGILKRDWENLQ